MFWRCTSHNVDRADMHANAFVNTHATSTHVMLNSSCTCQPGTQPRRPPPSYRPRYGRGPLYLLKKNTHQNRTRDIAYTHLPTSSVNAHEHQTVHQTVRLPTPSRALLLVPVSYFTRKRRSLYPVPSDAELMLKFTIKKKSVVTSFARRHAASCINLSPIPLYNQPPFSPTTRPERSRM